MILSDLIGPDLLRCLPTATRRMAARERVGLVTLPTDNAAQRGAESCWCRKVSISESRRDRDAREVREELLKRARDLHRRKRADRTKDALRRFEATYPNAKSSHIWVNRAAVRR